MCYNMVYLSLLNTIIQFDGFKQHIFVFAFSQNVIFGVTMYRLFVRVLMDWPHSYKYMYMSSLSWALVGMAHKGSVYIRFPWALNDLEYFYSLL